MKIVSLQAENIKKLVAVEITPDGNLVQITGKNGQGKTSVLDSIWWALAGASHIQTAPIRKGAADARIRLDLGEIKVTRTFRRKDEGGATTSIVVENADGARFTSPQKMLDALLGELSFDPLAFARMEPKAQVDALRRFVPGIDFDAIDAANKTDYDARTFLNRQAKDARSAAGQIQFPATTPEAPLDETELVQALAQAGDVRADIERRRAARERIADDVRSALDSIPRYESRIAELEAEIGAQHRLIDAARQRAASDQARLDQAGPLPDAPDVTDLQRRIENAREVNRFVADRQRRDKLIATAVEIEAKSAALTDRIEQRTEARRAAIAAAKMPVSGIEFSDGGVLLNGVPFDQASDAEQLRASVAIAIASNPKLRVIRIRDGSLLDDEAMQLLAQIADELDFQIWIERVDSSGRVGFVLEDGHVRQAGTEERASASRDASNEIQSYTEQSA